MLTERWIEDAIAIEQAEDVVWLNAGPARFLGLFTDTPASHPRGGVIILHDAAANPNWAETVRPLRLGLPRHGWVSLALQLPLRETGATIDDYAALLPEAALRIQAGIDFLRAKRVATIVLVGHGFGSVAAVHCLAMQPTASVSAAVLINISEPTRKDFRKTILEEFGKLTLPVLDIAEGSAEPSEQGARARRLAQKQNRGYRQLILKDTHLGDRDVEDALVNRIHGWLTRATSATE